MRQAVRLFFLWDSRQTPCTEEDPDSSTLLGGDSGEALGGEVWLRKAQSFDFVCFRGQSIHWRTAADVQLPLADSYFLQIAIPTLKRRGLRFSTARSSGLTPPLAHGQRLIGMRYLQLQLPSCVKRVREHRLEGRECQPHMKSRVVTRRPNSKIGA